MSTIKIVSYRGKVPYGRSIVKHIKNDIEEKVTQTLSSSAEELQPKNQVECSKRKNLDKLVVLLTETLSVSSQKEKVKLLTLTPES